MSYTLGPWRIGDAGKTVFGPPNGNPCPETIASVVKRANSPIIAAAPDAIEACRLVLQWAREGGNYGGNPYLMPFVKAAIVALEKAGESVN